MLLSLAILWSTLFLWLLLYRCLHGKVYEMDPAGHKFTFPLVWVPYRISYWIIFILSIVGTFTMGLWRFVPIGEMFLASAIQSLLFNLLANVFYESYIAAKYTMTGYMRSDYSAWKYSLVLTMGTSSVVWFIIGLVLAFVSVAGY